VLRAVILLLVCMNLGVASWWLWHRDAPMPRLPATERGIASLKLLSEVESPPTAQAADEMSAAPDALNAAAYCLSLGPFQTPADLRHAMNLLIPLVSRIQYREMPATAIRGYRVFLPAAGSRAQALATARELAAHGITDYYVVTAGDQQNTVSLGVFRDLANARQRHDQIATLGYNNVMEPRTEDVPQWWIDIATASEFDWRSQLPDPDLTAQPVACF
jgi:hypothetical protein